MTMSERVCIICAKTYTPWNRDQKCCGKECMEINNRNRVIKRHKSFTCKNCGKDFNNTGRGIKRKTYCSKKCSIEGKEKIYTERLLNTNNSSLENKNPCLVCGATLGLGRKKYCSLDCQKHGARIRARKNDRIRHQSRKEQAWSIKQEFVDKKGGCCEKCGYFNCLAALTFHHFDESTKEYTLDVSSIQRYKKELLEKELEKCQLLCFNCHMEIHNQDKCRRID